MGIVQGLAEFLPISSSGHLVITEQLYQVFTGSQMIGGENPEVIFFDIMVHVATLVAIFIYFWPELSKTFSPKNFVEHLKLYKISSITTIKKDLEHNYTTLSPENKLLFFLGISTVASVLIAYPIKDFAKMLTYNPYYVCGFLILTGLLLFISHFLTKKKSKTGEVTLSRALIMGFAQGFAVLPGISRSGSTIAAGLFTGLDRVSAARFSFIMSSPLIILAAAHESLELFREGSFGGFNWTAIMVGTLVSGVVGYLCIKYFLEFLRKYSLLAFAYYCIIAGFALGVFFNLRFEGILG